MENCARHSEQDLHDRFVGIHDRHQLEFQSQRGQSAQQARGLWHELMIANQQNKADEEQTQYLKGANTEEMQEAQKRRSELSRAEDHLTLVAKEAQDWGQDMMANAQTVST